MDADEKTLSNRTQPPHFSGCVHAAATTSVPAVNTASITTINHDAVGICAARVDACSDCNILVHNHFIVLEIRLTIFGFCHSLLCNRLNQA